MTPLESALADMQTAAGQLDVDQAAQTKTAAALVAAQSADQAAQATVTSDRQALQTKADAVVAAIVAAGLKVNVPSSSP